MGTLISRILCLFSFAFWLWHGQPFHDGPELRIVLVCIRGEVCSYFARLGAGSSTSTGSLNVPGSCFVRREEFESSPEFAEAAQLVQKNWGRYVLLGKAAMLAMAREAIWYSLGLASGSLDLYEAPRAEWVQVAEPRAESSNLGVLGKVF